MYTEINFRTKKAMKEAFKEGKSLRTYQPGGMFPAKTDGRACIEGPHYPEAHKWYASVELKDGIITKVIG